jgi:ATP-dependent protease ClpP protease subunit
MGAGYTMKASGQNQADIYIYEDVGEGWFGGVSARQFAADLKALGSLDTLNLHINSYGGEVFDGIAIYRTLVDHPAKVISYVDGVAASIASVIAMAGDEIRITESGFFMIHEASGGAFGRAAEHRQMADLLETITATIGDVYVARTGRDKAEVAAWMTSETWLTAQQALEYGFADEVVENLRLAAHVTAVADWTRHGFKNAPTIARPANAAQQAPVLPAPPKRAIAAPAATPVAAPKRDALSAKLAVHRAQMNARQTPTTKTPSAA